MKTCQRSAQAGRAGIASGPLIHTEDAMRLSDRFIMVAFAGWILGELVRGAMSERFFRIAMWAVFVGVMVLIVAKALS